MLIAALSADLYRAVRTPGLLVASVVVLLASCYGAFSLGASILAGFTPGLVLLTPGSGLAAPDVAPSLTGAVGATCLSGGLVPVVSSVLAACFLYQGLASGCLGGLVASGAKRGGLVAEAFAISLVTSALLLVVGSIPYLVCYGLGWIHAPCQTTVAAGAAWFILSSLHITLYSFLSGCLTLLMRRLWAGVASAVVLSSGAMDMLLSVLLGNAARAFPVAKTIRMLLPDSLADSLCASPLNLAAEYAGVTSLLAAAIVVYLVLIAVVAVGALVLGRGCSLICRRSI